MAEAALAAAPWRHSVVQHERSRSKVYGSSRLFPPYFNLVPWPCFGLRVRGGGLLPIFWGPRKAWAPSNSIVLRPNALGAPRQHRLVRLAGLGDAERGSHGGKMTCLACEQTADAEMQNRRGSIAAQAGTRHRRTAAADETLLRFHKRPRPGSAHNRPAGQPTSPRVPGHPASVGLFLYGKPTSDKPAHADCRHPAKTRLIAKAHQQAPLTSARASASGFGELRISADGRAGLAIGAFDPKQNSAVPPAPALVG